MDAQKLAATYPVFGRFNFTAPRETNLYFVNCLGAVARKHYMPADWYASNDALDVSEDCFEWHDMLCTIESAGDELVFAYLGCGYGRWLVNAALAARQLGKHARLLG